MLACIDVAAIGFLLVWHFRPLLPTGEISAYEVVNGVAAPMRAYTRLGFPREYWIRGKSGVFVILPEKLIASYPIHMRKIPYLHYNHDMCLGAPIDDPIKSGGRYLTRTRQEISFVGRHGNIYIVKMENRETRNTHGD
jgi:hypothetical protein